MATTKIQAALQTAKRSFSAGSVISAIGRWIVRNRIYLIAFAIPAVLTYLAYALFGLYPFGEESVLCLDLNGQYVYYFEALRDAFWGDGSIFYNWSRNLSGEFMGIIGYYLASPFTLIVMLLPEKFMLSSLLIMQLCKLGAAGATFNYFLQKRRGVQPYPSLLFSTMYAMMAYGVIQLIDPMWLDGLVFLPLIMLGIEYLVDDGRRLNFIIPLALMCVANFYIGYMICFFVILYFLFYLCFGSDKKRKGYDYFTAFVRIAYSSVIALACAAFMLLPVYNALKLGKFEFTDPDYSFRFQSFPLSKKLLENAQDSPLLVFLCDLLDMFPQLPAQYDSVNVQGKPEIYCGLLTLVLMPLFYLNKKVNRKKKIGYSLLIAVMVMCMLITPIDMMWHGGQVPNWLPFRYAFLLSFVFLTMAATAFANRDGIEKKHLIGSAVIMAVIIAIVAGLKFDQMAKGAVWISAALMGIYLILLYFMLGGKITQGKRGVSVALTTMMLIMVGGEATYNAVDSMKDIDKEVAYSTRASYQNYVQNGRAATQMLEEKDDGFYRAEKTFFRCVNDNAAFGLKGISHSSSVMNTRAINFIETLGYCMHSYYTRYDGNTEIADSLLGIKYVLDRGESGDQNRRLNPAYEARWAYDYTNENGTAKTITAYENTNALSIGYMVDEDVQKIDHLGNDNPFNSQNIFMSTMSGQTTFDENGQFQSWHEYYTPLNLAENPIVSDAITTSPYGEQTKYDVTGDGDPTVDFHLVAESNEPIYIYFKTEFQKKVNLWMSTWNDSEWSEAENGWKESNSGDFTWKDADEYAKNNGGFQSMGEYFEGDNYIALRLGTFEPGTKITLRMTIANEEKFTIVKNFLFYTYHPDVFQEDIDILKQNQWQIDTKKSNDRKLTGTITAEEGQIMMTSIPDQPGWTVKVDGKKVDQVAIVDAMIGVPLSAGEHTVTMTYTPPGWWIGMGTLAGGIILIVLFWFGDRKRYAAMLAEIEAEKEREQQQAKKRVKLKSGTKDKANDDSPEKLLEKLEALHQQGILDDKEFAAKKAEIEKKKKADGKQT